MRFAFLESQDVYENLALEECLYLAEDLWPTFLLWRNRPAVVCGAYQNLYQEVNLPLAQKAGVAFARRSSGGGTVYHDLGNINYSFILPAEGLAIDYEGILGKICRALGRMGLEISIDQTSDLLWEGKKISGNAQKKGRKALLHHGTLLYDCDLQALSAFANGHSPYYHSKATRSRPRTVVNLSEAFGDQFDSIEDFMKDFKEAIAKEHSLDSWSPPADLLQKARDLAQEKYRSFDWIYGKNPAFTYDRQEELSPDLERIAYRFKKGRIYALAIDIPQKLPKLIDAGEGLALTTQTIEELCQKYGQGLIHVKDFF